TAALHLVQPVARLWGRLRHGLSPWRRRGSAGLAWPRRREVAIWTEDWQEPAARVATLEAALRARGAVVRHGSAYDDWDLEVRGGAFASARILMACEDHGQGTQYVRVRVSPRVSRAASVIAILGGLAAAAIATGP